MLSTKNLRVAIKKTATVKSLCTEYNCTEEELLARIDSLYHLNPGDAKKIIASLRTNEKRAMKKFKRSGTGSKNFAKTTTSMKAPVADNISEEDSSTKITEDVVSEANVTSSEKSSSTGALDTMRPVSPELDNMTEVPASFDTMKQLPNEESNAAEAPMCLDTMRHAPDTALLTESLEELKKLEEAMSTAVTNSENLHKLYAAKHRKVREEFTRISEEVGEYRRALAACRVKFEELFKEEAEISQEIQTIHGRIVSERNYLDKIRAKIKELDRIEVYAYNNGEITIEKNGFIPDESGCEEIFNELVHNDSCGDLRARDIKLLARVMAITKNTDKDLVITFEGTDIEDVYNSVKA